MLTALNLLFQSALLVVLMAMPVSAQIQPPGTDGWVTLGRYTVPAGAISARFDVKRGSDRFNASRLVVISGELDLERVVVGYGNGSVHYEDRPVRLETGDRMARMDDREELRSIEYIDIYLKPGVVTSRNTVVEIGGIKNPPPATTRSASTASAPRTAKRSAVPFAKSPQESTAGRLPMGGSAVPPPPPPPPVATAPAPQPGAPVVDAAKPKVAFDGTDKSAQPAASSQPPAADDGKAFTPVPVFFGTDRKREADRSKWDRKLAAFSGNSDGTSSWGKAVVSVPKAGREKGEIRRPEWDLFFTTVSLRAEDLARDFVLLNVDVLDRNQFVAEIKSHAQKAVTFKDQAFVFVHGYRVSFDDALFRAAQITHDMGFDGLPFVYSWPSSAGVAGYLYDERRALGAREPLRAFLEMVTKESGAKKVHLIAHSMGAQALLEVLRDIKNIGGPAVAAGPIFNEVILAAPDVTRDNFGLIAAQVRGLATGITLYASANDRALRLSQKLSGASAGAVPANGPVVVPGVDSIDVSAASTDFFSLNHSTFADRSQLLDDMRLLIENGVRPPDQRVKAYTPVVVTGGKYWRFDR